VRRARTDATTAAINAVPSSVVDYGPDPRGWGMFAALSGAHNRDLNTQRTVIETSHTDSGGWHAPLQRMRGLAPLILGSGRAVTKKSSVIGDERSDPGENAAERILAERWKRQGGGPDW
jgi:hypothetical protein